MLPSLNVSVTLQNEKVLLFGEAGANVPVHIDYYPPFGDGQGYTSLELLLMSLSSCSGHSVLMLLRRMKKTVTGFSVRGTALRREEHPTVLTKITLQFVITSSDAVQADVQKAIALSEETYCPVWAMLKGNVEIIPEIVLNASPKGCQ